MSSSKQCKEVLEVTKPGEHPNVVFMPVTENQLLQYGSKYTSLKNEGKRTITKKYGDICDKVRR